VIRPAVIWFVVASVYVAFFAWYTGSGEPLTTEEIDAYMESLAQGGRDPARLDEFRSFLEADTGGDIIIVNAIELHEQPIVTGDVQPGETSAKVLERYMAYMWPALLRRACHPVVGGDARITVESWGVEGAESWSSAGLMRYRSRRDLMEIATNPEFDDAHQYKVAAMSKTVAFAIDPLLNLGEPRLIIGLLLFSLGALLQLLLGRGGSRSHGASRRRRSTARTP
jgi:hypothetical protein